MYRRGQTTSCFLRAEGRKKVSDKFMESVEFWVIFIPARVLLRWLQCTYMPNLLSRAIKLWENCLSHEICCLREEVPSPKNRF